MPNVLRTVMTVLASLLLLVSSCKKTVEGESQRWEAGVTEVKGLMAQYPGFKPALEARLARAQGIYDAASSLGEEQKIAKMAEANGELRKDFVGELTGLFNGGEQGSAQQKDLDEVIEVTCLQRSILTVIGETQQFLDLVFPCKQGIISQIPNQVQTQDGRICATPARTELG